MKLLTLAPWSVVAALAFVLAGPTAAARAGFTNLASTVLGTVDYDSRSASLADIDGDGDLDLFFQGAGSSSQKLYRNNVIGTGAFTFTDISSTLPGGVSASWSAAWGDYDGDRRVDVFIGQSNTAVGAAGDLLKNNGAAGFANVSVATGLNDGGFHQNVAWADIDNDRDLDLLIGMEGAEKHEIYVQGPAGHFSAVGAAAGFQQDLGTRGYGMAIGDTDGDGDLDVYISTCQPGGNVRNNFYKNMLVENGSLSFVDLNAGANNNGTQNFTNTYGAEFHDFDNDADLDLFVVGADRQPSKIYRNDGGNQFTDVDAITGHALLTDVGGDLGGARAVDYDNDGDLDLFFHDHLNVPNVSNQARKLYRNDGNWQFTDVTTAQGLNAVNMGAYDSTWGDLDRDGDQDLVAPTGSGFNERLFVNDASTNGNHWLYVDLEGPKDNTSGLGAALYATMNQGTPQELTLRREANTNAGTFNQSDLPVHFGLGAATTIDELRIVWRDGTVQTLYDVAANQYLTVRTPGDFNGDGVVDGADVVQWTGDFAMNDESDADHDGDTDGADFLWWQRQLGNGLPAGGGATSVPELPAAALALAALAGVRRRRDARAAGAAPGR